MHSMGVGLIIIGSACYLLGVLFFKMEKIKYSHLIWHLFVIAGSVCHWVAIYGYTLDHYKS
jgi:hemolysin III